ncbi:hypothetical protein ABS767_16070 [Sphingomonas sp. ST-64]|uniref:Uncharacterized protein n=1 Tax=Sphingomonas plantiphila TaxID=3163295 RepID=A0ABW8YRD5_9SPHN
MRFVAAIVGILISIPPLIFFGVGAQTFIRRSEKIVAMVVTAESLALLIVSAMLLFTGSVQRVQGGLLALTLATIFFVVVFSRAGR